MLFLDDVFDALGAPYYTLHRGDLHHALVDVLPADRLHLGYRFIQLMDHSDRIEARFENGASVSSDALIGADGIHSVVRRALFGPEKPRFTGCVAHRGLVSADRLVHLGLKLEKPNLDGAWPAFCSLLRFGGDTRKLCGGYRRR
jgi:salicylate hydroxylase